MFAVIKTGGKQYKVSPGTLLKVERLEGDAGQSIHLSSVLLLNDEGAITVGAPLLDQVKVSETILEQTRADKIIVFKKKRRQGYRRKAGHRQDITILRIEEILTPGKTHSHPKLNDSKKLSQASVGSPENASVSVEAHTSPAAKTEIIAKKPKVKKEVDISAVNPSTEAVSAEIVPKESVKKSVKKASSDPLKQSIEDKDKDKASTGPEKKKPSTETSDSKPTNSK